MPCLILTGHPCSGKTTLAKLIAERAFLQPSIDNVVTINEESTILADQVTKNDCYCDTNAEKKTRGALKAAFDRAQSGSDNATAKTANTLVVLDSLNYIKGYRYELYCISKAAKTQHGVVWVLNDYDTIQKWNEQSQHYSTELLHALVQRYEPPDVRNRWDSPLYRIHVVNNNDTGKYNNSSDDNNNPNVSQSSQNTTTKTPSETTTSTAIPIERSMSDQVAKDSLSKSVYNMHNLSNAISVNPNDEPVLQSSPVVIKTTQAPTRSGFKRATPPATLPVTTTVEKEKSTINNNNNGISNNYGNNTTVPNQKSPSLLTKTKSESITKSLVDQVDEMLVSFLAGQPLSEGASTRQHVASDANVLHSVDVLTMQVIKAIQTSQNCYSATTTLTLSIPEKSSKLGTFQLSSDKIRPVKELQRQRQQFIKWVATYPPQDTSENGIIKSFLAFIESQS